MSAWCDYCHAPLASYDEDEEDPPAFCNSECLHAFWKEIDDHDDD